MTELIFLQPFADSTATIYFMEEYKDYIDDMRVDFASVRAFAINGWQLDDTHGMPHWQRVERNAMLLLTRDASPAVVRLFAYLHDKCRHDNLADMGHGRRAAEMLPSLRGTLLKGLNDAEFADLVTACREHTVTARTGSPTIDICFDADRLDLGRVGITPDPARMATTRGRHFAAHPADFAKAVKEFERWKAASRLPL